MFDVIFRSTFYMSVSFYLAGVVSTVWNLSRIKVFISPASDCAICFDATGVITARAD